MAFRFNWPRFDPDFVERARDQITLALNKNPESRPNKIAGRIEVKELDLGTQPPELEMLEVGELTEEKFRGIFKITYAGDAYLILQTKVQANPLQPSKHPHTRTLNLRSSPSYASEPLLVPMHLRISSLRLKGIAALTVDRNKGVTLSFKTDPLESVDVGSSFDGAESVRRFLQSAIEGQLRKLFVEDLPSLLHGLSLQVMQGKRAGNGAPVQEYVTVSAHQPAYSASSVAETEELRRGTSSDSSSVPRSPSRRRSMAHSSITPLTSNSSTTASTLDPIHPLLTIDSGFVSDIADRSERYYFLHSRPVTPEGPANPPSHPPGPRATSSPHERWWSSTAPGAPPVQDRPVYRTARWAGNEAWEALAMAVAGGDGEWVLHRGLDTPLVRTRGKGKGRWGGTRQSRTSGILMPSLGDGLAGVEDLKESLEFPAALTRAEVRFGMGQSVSVEDSGMSRSSSTDHGWTPGHGRRQSNGTATASEGSDTSGGTAGVKAGRLVTKGGSIHPHAQLAYQGRWNSSPIVRTRSMDRGMAVRTDDPEWKYVRPLHPPLRRPTTPALDSPGLDFDFTSGAPIVLSPFSRVASRIHNLSTFPLTASVSSTAGTSGDLVALRTTPRARTPLSRAHSVDDLRSPGGMSRTPPARRVRRVKLAATPIAGVGLWPSTSGSSSTKSLRASVAGSTVSASETETSAESWDARSESGAAASTARGRHRRRVLDTNLSASADGLSPTSPAGEVRRAGPMTVSAYGDPLGVLGLSGGVRTYQPAVSPIAPTPLTAPQLVRSPFSHYGAGLALSASSPSRLGFGFPSSPVTAVPSSPVTATALPTARDSIVSSARPRPASVASAGSVSSAPSSTHTTPTKASVRAVQARKVESGGKGGAGSDGSKEVLVR